MSTDASTREGLVLKGLDGSNPLGFLAALGTLRALTSAWPDRNPRMCWRLCNGVWHPKIGAANSLLSADTLAATLAEELRCGFEPTPSLEKNRETAQKKYEDFRSQIKKLREDIKKRGLGKKEREAAEQVEVTPLQTQADTARAEWLSALAEVVPFGEMRLGKHLDSNSEEFRETALALMADARHDNRESVDALAAFASDACFDEKSRRIEATPLCFATGSGHQYFLDTARQLVGRVTQERIEQALCKPWLHRDEKLSMRWDPVEDRRYALMWTDPTASNNKALTNWAANLLAYRGVSMLVSAPTARRLRTTAFQKQRIFKWPLWSPLLNRDEVAALLRMPLRELDEEATAEARARGIVAAYMSERLTVGKPPLHKYNFSPARALL